MNVSLQSVSSLISVLIIRTVAECLLASLLAKSPESCVVAVIIERCKVYFRCHFGSKLVCSPVMVFLKSAKCYLYASFLSRLVVKNSSLQWGAWAQ